MASYPPLRSVLHVLKGPCRASLVDDITFSAAAKKTNGLTASAILGPFWRRDTPRRQNGSTIALDMPPDGRAVYMHGKVSDVDTGKPLVSASLDVWQASTNGRKSSRSSAACTDRRVDQDFTSKRPLRAARPRAKGVQPPRHFPDRCARQVRLLLPEADGVSRADRRSGRTASSEDGPTGFPSRAHSPHGREALAPLPRNGLCEVG